MKEKVHLVFASLFTDRAISYRHDRGGAQGCPGSRDWVECRLDFDEEPTYPQTAVSLAKNTY